tara:strand:+ start:121 stop:810 length:690 start_codon:yes stop_codon:yes gene_type:complete
MAFNFVTIDESKLPKTKGKRIDGMRFYSIEGHNYPSVTTVLNYNTGDGIKKWRESIGEAVANWEMGRAARRGKSTHNLVEEYIRGETPSERSVLPLGLFKILKPYLDQIDNVHMLETIMYSKELTLAGQVDCIADYNGKLSVIDFKTSNKFKEEAWVQNYFMQCTAYAIMYEELFGKHIEQIVVLIASEDGTSQAFVKQTKDFVAPLKETIQGFYKYYQEQNKDKIKQE